MSTGNGEGKGQHTYVWAMDSCNLHVESTSLLKEESQTYSYTEN